MQKNVITTVGELSLCDAGVGHASIGFNGNKAELFVNDVDPGKEATTDDFDVPAQDDSDPIVITWGDPYINASGDAEVASQLLSWAYVTGDSETLFGVTLRDGVDRTKLNGYARLDTGKEFAAVGDVLQLVVRLTFSDDGWGISIQVSE